MYETFDEIQYKLHKRGKQFPTYILNSDTKFIRFKRNSTKKNKLIHEESCNNIEMSDNKHNDNEEWKTEEIEQMPNDVVNDVEMVVQLQVTDCQKKKIN
eukprot:241170_1